jgi:hypothetical protein
MRDALSVGLLIGGREAWILERLRRLLRLAGRYALLIRRPILLGWVKLFKFVIKDVG